MRHILIVNFYLVIPILFGTKLPQGQHASVVSYTISSSQSESFGENEIRQKVVKGGLIWVF